MSSKIKKENQSKNREIFLDSLPKKKSGSSNSIDWISSIGNIVKGIYDGVKFEVKIVDYRDKYLYIKYLDKPVFKIWTSNFVKGNVGGVVRKNTGEFKIEIGITFRDENRNMTITDREMRVRYKKDGSFKCNDKWYQYTCNKCGWTEGWLVESSLITGGGGCSCCHGISKLGINTIWDKARWMVDLGVSEEDAKTHTPQSNDRIYPTCPDCGRIKDKSIPICKIHYNHSISCSCSDKISYPNKFAYSLLNQLNELYKFDCLEREYSPEWIGRKSYDNYFVHNGKGYILEMDGLFHYKDNSMNGQTKEESKEIDNYKDKFAKEHNIEVIRIDCKKSELEFIKQNILSSSLLEFFDLSKIDWLKCEEFALSNLIKATCDYKKNNINLTCREIAKIMKLSANTIRTYLKKGNIIGWCHYNAEEEANKSRYKKKSI